jgi:hypothetical protein
MATTGLMLQLEVEQQLSTDVSSINEIFAEAATFLNGGTVTVTEIAVQKLGGVFGNNIAIPIDDSPTGYVTLRVFTGATTRLISSRRVRCRRRRSSLLWRPCWS